MAYTLGLDIGTTSIKAVLFNTCSGIVETIYKKPTPSTQSSHGFTEHDPESLWLTAAGCIKHAVQDKSITGISISSFAEAGLPVDDHLKPLYPIIAWFDERSKPQYERVIQQLPEKEIFNITGQKARYSFGLFKLLWLQENFPERMKKMRYWLSTPDYIFYRLSNSLATDYTIASRTLMFDQATLNWSQRMLSIANLSPDMLPVIFPSGTKIGVVTGTASELTGLALGTPCILGGHDHLCGTFACGSTLAGDYIDSMGTSCAIITLTGSFAPQDDLFNKGFDHYAHVVPGTFLIKGGMHAAGRGVAWFNEIFKHIHQELSTEDLIQLVGDLPVWLPFFHGSGTPDRQPFARAALFGLHPAHTRESIYCALLAGFAFWLRENLNFLESITGNSPDRITAIGGSNQNINLLQLKASVLDKSIMMPSTPEASAVGAALLAAVGSNIVPTYQDAAKLNRYGKTVINSIPDITDQLALQYQKRYLPLRRTLSPLQEELFNE